MNDQPLMDHVLERRIAELDLSPREKEIALYWALDYDSKQIGKALSISENTVRSFVNKINQKLQVNSKASLILKIIGLI